MGYPLGFAGSSGKTIFLAAAASLLIALSVTFPQAARASAEKVIYGFRGAPSGASPNESPAFNNAGELMGATKLGGTQNKGTIYLLKKTNCCSWSGTNVYSFKGNPDGAYPQSPLVFDGAGNAYGTTYAGGPSAACPDTDGCGVVFRLSYDAGRDHWIKKNIYEFQGGSHPHNPTGALLFDSHGRLWGTTQHGGLLDSGTVFFLLPGTNPAHTWHERSYAVFLGEKGASPNGALTLGAGGYFYGTTQSGGHNGVYGTVFRFKLQVLKKLTYEVIYDFKGGNDGKTPKAGVVLDSAGNVYGSTYDGGDTTFCPSGCGIIFMLSPPISGRTWDKKNIHQFSPGPNGDGSKQSGGLAIDANDILFGTTESGGADMVDCFTNGCGTVFSLTPNGDKSKWQQRILHNFINGGDGAKPVNGTPVLDAGAGTLYGTTSTGGTQSEGTVYSIRLPP